MRRLRFDHRMLVVALAVALPAAFAALLLVWFGDFSTKLRWTVTIIVAGSWLIGAFGLRERVIRPLQTISNVIAALREGDYSIRARRADTDDSLGLAYWELNMLSDVLRGQRLGALEATTLLRRVIAEVDVAIFTFDQERRLRLVNRAGERLLARPAARLLGRTADQLGLTACLEGQTPRTDEIAFAGRVGRWEVRRSTFRQGGLPHQLVVISDLSRALREEERQAWQRLVRVLSHEINNSLAPIKSIAASLEEALRREEAPADWDADLQRGLAIIAGRAESLSRFMASYARLARLPRPRSGPVDVEALVQRVAGLEPRLAIEVVAGPRVTVPADADQLEQLLINLVSNGSDAALETGGGVRVGWNLGAADLELWVEDDGPGLADTTNLFVPFFTTKPRGSGIGLVLSRQIAEAHGGTLTLQNRHDRRGCVARVRLPRAGASTTPDERPGSTTTRTSPPGKPG